MTRTFYTADLHLGHEFVAHTRRFKTSKAHDRALVENWENMIGPKDTVWVLGDLCIRDYDHAEAILQRLPGEKHLVLGNHDHGHPMHRRWKSRWRRYLDTFETVSTEATVRMDGQQVKLCHFPPDGDHPDKHGNRQNRYPEWRPRVHPPDQWVIHGHVHDTWKVRMSSINVGLDVWHMNPVPEQDILDILRDN